MQIDFSRVTNCLSPVGPEVSRMDGCSHRLRCPVSGSQSRTYRRLGGTYRWLRWPHLTWWCSTPMSSIFCVWEPVLAGRTQPLPAKSWFSIRQGQPGRVPGANQLASMKLAFGQLSTLAKIHAQHSQWATPLVLCYASRPPWPKAKFIHFIGPSVSVINRLTRETCSPGWLDRNRGRSTPD